MLVSQSETVVIHPVHPRGLTDLLRAEPKVELVAPDNGQGVVGALHGGAPILVTYLWDDSYLTSGLRWVQSLSAGMEQFPAEALRAENVALTSARGVHAPSVAEHAIALLLAITRGIGPSMRDVSTHSWTPHSGFEVGGRTLGVIGLGSVGEQVARLAVGLGMRVIGTKANPAGYDGVCVKALGPEHTLDVCEEADALVIAVPHDESTEGLIGARELESLGRGWLVNVGRGTAVDEAALATALGDGRLRGAGLDVFIDEPLPGGSPLWALPNVVITPHVAWSSDQLAERMARRIVHNLAAYRGRGSWIDRWT